MKISVRFLSVLLMVNHINLIFIQMLAFRGYFFRDGWNILDSIIVVLSIIDLMVDLGTSGGTGQFSPTILKVTKVFKILRMGRLLKLIKVKIFFLFFVFVPSIYFCLVFREFVSCLTRFGYKSDSVSQNWAFILFLSWCILLQLAYCLTFFKYDISDLIINFIILQFSRVWSRNWLTSSTTASTDNWVSATTSARVLSCQKKRWQRSSTSWFSIPRSRLTSRWG